MTIRPRNTNSGAFTLVEMLAVILVIGILVTVVVGVAGRVIARAAEERTRVYMATVMNAIAVYEEQYGTYPITTGGSMQDHNANLYKLLTDHCPAAKKRLGQLSRGAYVAFSFKTYFADGFGNPLRYHVSGGAGGAPYLESAGRDGDFTTTEDNIRSDNR